MRINFFVVFLFWFSILSAQNVRPVLDAILKKDQSLMEKLFSEQVSGTIENNTVSGISTVIQELQEFVAQNQIKNQKIIHETIARGSGHLMGIGSLSSDKSKFRVYLTFVPVQGKTVVQTIKVERDEL
jgi:hypothetical protein